MAERTKNDDFAEKAYAAAAAEMKSAGKPAAGSAKASVKAKGTAPAKAAEPAKRKKSSDVKKPASSPAPRTSAAPEKAAILPPVETKAPKAPAPAAAKDPAPAAPKAPAPAQATASAQPAAPAVPPAPAPVAEAPKPITPVPTTPELKETNMASAPKSNDNVQQINNTMTSAMSEIQTRAKAAYDKGTETAGEVTEFAKGNVEAVVESTKIFAAGVQDLGRSYVEEARTAYETMSADVKEMAGVKSPTELFQLQGKIVRRNLDAMIATSSKNTEALMKLASEAFAPLTGRVNVAAEKLTKVA
jgi:phasin family protein